MLKDYVCPAVKTIYLCKLVHRRAVRRGWPHALHTFEKGCHRWLSSPPCSGIYTYITWTCLLSTLAAPNRFSPTSVLRQLSSFQSPDDTLCALLRLSDGSVRPGPYRTSLAAAKKDLAELRLCQARRGDQVAGRRKALLDICGHHLLRRLLDG